jgi:hypothetical protein
VSAAASPSIRLPLRVVVPVTVSEPALTRPVVVIVSEPLSIAPKPEVIEPASSAPTSTTLATVVIDACVPDVTVAAVPLAFPVTSPVTLPVNHVLVRTPLLGL